MQIEILGSGGAVTTPKPLCECRICMEAREKGIPYSRSGPSVFIHGPNLLIDTPEDIFLQLNRAEIKKINLSRSMQWFGTTYTRRFNFLGSKDFIDRIRSAYPGKMANREVAEKVRAGRENDPKVLLKKGAEILTCDIDELRFSRRISQKEKEGRDLLIYVLWETGCYSAHEIGGLLGLGYSSVSKRVGIIEYRISRERELRKRYDRLKSLIKL